MREGMARGSRCGVAVRVALITACTGGVARGGEVRWVPTQHATIQSAVDASSDGDVVLVMPGTYAPFVLSGKGVVVSSVGGPASARIDGGGVAPCVVMNGPRPGVGASLRGFTLRGGNGQNGGGVYAWGGVTVESCVVEQCGAVNGGGVFLGGGATLRDCTVRGNAALHGGGVALAPGGDAVVEACTIEDNAARLGGGLFAAPHADRPAALVLRGCVVRGNRAIDGGGVAVVGGTLLASGVSVEGNEAIAAGGGVFAHEGGAVAFDAGTLRGNTAADGAAAVASAFGSVSMIESSVLSNAAGPGSAAVVARQGYAEVIASEMAGNTPADIAGPVVVGDGWAPPPCELAWLAPPFDTFDVNDIIAFGTAFGAQAPAGDLAAPEGVWNVDDLLAFVEMLGGC